MTLLSLEVRQLISVDRKNYRGLAACPLSTGPTQKLREAKFPDVARFIVLLLSVSWLATLDDVNCTLRFFTSDLKSHGTADVTTIRAAVSARYE